MDKQSMINFINYAYVSNSIDLKLNFNSIFLEELLHN